MQQPSIHPIDALLQKIGVWDVVKATFTIAAVLLAAWLTYRFFALIIAIMLYLAIRPLVESLNRIGINKRVGTIVGYMVVILFIVGFLFLLIPLLITQARTITEKLPEYYMLLKQLLVDSNVSLFQLIASYLPAELQLDRIPALLMSVPESTGDAAAKPVSPIVTPETVFFLFFLVTAVFAMAYYWMRDRDKIVYQFLLFFPPTQRDTVEKLIEEIEEKVGSFYQGQLILCAIVGGTSFVAYWLIGLPYALTLGAFAFIFEAVPLIGPFLGAIPAVLIALTISPIMTFAVIAVNSTVQFLENNILVPRIMGRTVGIHPILTVLAIAGFTTLFGLSGALLAIPLAAIIHVLFERIVFRFQPTTTGDHAVADVHLNIKQRNRFSVMRMEAQELAHDVRKGMRQQGTLATGESIQIEELIESLATEVDQLLTRQERMKRRSWS